MPRANEARFVLIQIDDRQKIRREGSVLALHGEILLVAAHHCDQDFLRQLQIRGVKPTQYRRGILVEIRHQIHQVRVLVNPQPFAACQPPQLSLDLLPALFGPDQNKVRLQLLYVILYTAYRYFRLAQKTVPGRTIPRHRIAQGDPQGLSSEQRHHPANRPYEVQPFGAGPVHAARPGYLGNRSRKNLFQNFFCRPSPNDLRCAKIFALGRRNRSQLANRQIHFLREAFGGARWLPRSIIRNGLRRPGNFLRLVRLMGAQVRAGRYEPAWRSKDFDARVLHQVMRGQILLKYYLQFFYCPGQHPRRNFFAANFKQEVRRRLHRRTSAMAAALRASDCCARKSTATRQAIWRMRPISCARSVVEITPRESSKLNRWEHFRQ